MIICRCDQDGVFENRWRRSIANEVRDQSSQERIGTTRRHTRSSMPLMPLDVGNDRNV